VRYASHYRLGHVVSLNRTLQRRYRSGGGHHFLGAARHEAGWIRCGGRLGLRPPRRVTSRRKARLTMTPIAAIAIG
jgi:hypothetical protein